MVFVIWDVSKIAVKRDAADSIVLWLINQVLTQPAKFMFFRLTPTGQGKAELKRTHFSNSVVMNLAEWVLVFPLGYGWWYRDTSMDLTLPVALGNLGGEQGEGFACVRLPRLWHLSSVLETEFDLAGEAWF